MRNPPFHQRAKLLLNKVKHHVSSSSILTVERHDLINSIGVTVSCFILGMKLGL